MAPMHIGLDVTAAISGTTGVARYARQLLAHLPEHDDVEVHPFAIGRSPRPAPVGARHLRVPLRVVHAAWRSVPFPGARTLAGPVHLVHAVDMVPPPGRVPAVVTIHDVLPLQIPEEYGPRYRRIAAAQAKAARRGATVIADCEASADAIAEVIGIPREGIAVALLGHREPAADPISAPVEGPYLLAVGALTPRKGFHLLAEAVGRLPAGTPPLLVAGPDGWAGAEVRQRIAALGLGDRVQLLGEVSDRQLDGLYRGALLACHPSRAEGFGMPCLEAMRFGVPLLAADIPPVREITGGAARLVPRDDVGALAEALADLLDDESARRALVSAGRARAEDFSWATMTDRVVDVYRAVLA